MKNFTLSLFMLGMMVLMGSTNAHADGVLAGLDHSFQIKGNMQVEMQAGTTVLITLANGEVFLIDQPDQLPSNLKGATIDVFDGCVKAVAQNNVSLCIGPSQGSAVALLGSTSMTTDEGKPITLNEGDEYYITFTGDSEEELAPPTAASGEILGRSINGFSPVDGTNTRDRRASESP